MDSKLFIYKGHDYTGLIRGAAKAAEEDLKNPGHITNKTELKIVKMAENNPKLKGLAKMMLWAEEMKEHKVPMPLIKRIMSQD